MAQGSIAPHAVTIERAKLHYLTAGHGPTLILLHGYTQTSRMWRPIIPLLAEKFTVIAPDPRGIGDSAIPKDGLDMKTTAVRIHALAKSLGIEKPRVVGHDIGLMVAYACAAQFPEETEKLVLMDAFLHGLPDGKRYTTTSPSGTSDSTVPRRKPWSGGASTSISMTSGITSPKIGGTTIRSISDIAKNQRLKDNNKETVSAM